jgi:hypothetical protein
MATDWEYDSDFFALLERAARLEHGLSCLIVQPSNLQETVDRYRRGDLTFDFLYDRGSDTSPEFLELNNLAARDGIPVLDPLLRLKWASDKATMHLEFIAHGLMTPYTIIIPPYIEQKSLALTNQDLEKLGPSFFIKPANTTGGGIGVFEGGTTLKHVLEVRREFAADKYLLQERVRPIEREARRFWFRGFFCCGSVECCWWDPEFHIYDLLTTDQAEMCRLGELFEIVRKISLIVKLNFFSTEIALSQEDRFIVVDYVNEVCDMRLKSGHVDGVPDKVVNRISENIAAYVKHHKKSRSGAGR